MVSMCIHQAILLPTPAPTRLLLLNFTFFFFFFFALSTPTLSQPPPPISGLFLNCGSDAPIDLNGLLYVPDSPFVSSAAGTAKSLPLPGLLPTLSSLRSFPFAPSSAAPRPRKFCYSLPAARGSRYLLRTTYFYGGPGSLVPPVFDLLVDGTFWTVVDTRADNGRGMASSYEGVFMARGRFVRVCVAGNPRYTDSDPFVNAVEMVVLEDSVYNSTDFGKNAMGLVARSRFGYDGPTVRYPDDRFNRYWQPFMSNNTGTASNSQKISASSFWNLPPSNIFDTALTTDHQDNLMELQWPPESLANSSYYIALYFADTSLENPRAFDVYINGYSFYNNLQVTSSGLVVFATKWNLSGLTRIILSPTSALSPIINAGEIFGIFPLGGTTHTRDAIALERVKKGIQNPPLDWTGDPCMPRGYSWSGIICSEGSKIRVISLNLSSMGLSGYLSPNVANLSALTFLSLADNAFFGPIPDLSRLRMLEKLHLQDNQMNGTIPESLGNLKSIQEIFLQNNNLNGKIPPNLGTRPGLLVRLSPGNHFS